MNSTMSTQFPPSQAARYGGATERLPYAALVHEDRVHGSLYTNPLVFADEMQRIFHEGWVYVGHESEVPEAGDYVARRIGRQPMILSRDGSGQLQLLYDRCTHRGNRICPSERGKASQFVCRYHGWVFDTRGTLVSMPAPQGFPEDCGKDELSMARAPRLDTYGGFIFASLAEQGISLDAHLGRGKAMIDMLNGLSPSGRIRLNAGWMKHRLQGNWKGILENQVDGYHPAFVHTSLLRAKREFVQARDRKDSSASRVRDLGCGHSEVDFAADFRQRDVLLGWTGPVHPDKLPRYVTAMETAYGAQECRRRLVDGPPHAVIFPNLFLAEMNIMVIEPISATETVQYTTAVMLEEGYELNLRSLRRCEGALGPAGFLISDDAEISDMVQRGLGADEPEWVLLKRGLHTEERTPDGIRTGELKDETSQRAFWRHYRHLMEGATA